MKNSLYLYKYNLLKPGSLKKFREIMRNEAMPPEDLAKKNWCQTADLVRHALQSSPFYSKHFQGVSEMITGSFGESDFCKLPILQRVHLQAHATQLLCADTNLRRCNYVTTGGSTGQPVGVYHPIRVPRAAAMWRMMTWWQIAPGSDIATVHRESRTKLVAKLSDALVWWPARRFLLDAASITSEKISRWLTLCQKARPPLLHGYVGGLDAVAQFMLDNGLKSWKPKAIWTTSSPLSEVQRRRIEKAFSAPVFDQYGCCEVFYLAAETPFGEGLAVFSDLRRIEVVDDENRPVPDGVEGRILVTDLENWDFPIIRYEVGDRGRFLPDQTPWKLPFQRIAPIKGRISDNIVLGDGTTISGEFLTTLFDDCPEAVERFQVVYTKDDAIAIRFVPSKQGNFERQFEEIRQKLEAVVQSASTVRMERVDSLPDKRGKIQFVFRE